MTSTAATISTQLLQVPKPLPHGRTSRSQSRPRSHIKNTEDAVLTFHRTAPASPPPLALPVQDSPKLGSGSIYNKTCCSGCVCDRRSIERPPIRDVTGLPIAGFEPTPCGDRNVDIVPSSDADIDAVDSPIAGGLSSLSLRLPATPRLSPGKVPLSQRIIGTWRLESYIAYPTPSCTFQRPTYPMSKNVTGLIMYTPDGYMSAQMLIPGQKSFKRGEGDEAQWAEAAKRCFSYCGPYYITDDGSDREEVLRHTFQVCSLPGWIGDLQIRTWKFEEDGMVLVLGSETPTVIKGDERIPVLKWRRAIDNTGKRPPPPMPQIKISGPGEL